MIRLFIEQKNVLYLVLLKLFLVSVSFVLQAGQNVLQLILHIGHPSLQVLHVVLNRLFTDNARYKINARYSIPLRQTDKHTGYFFDRCFVNGTRYFVDKLFATNTRYRFKRLHQRLNMLPERTSPTLHLLLFVSY